MYPVHMPDRRMFFQINWGLVLTTMLLFAVGMVNLYSASGARVEGGFVLSPFFHKQLVWGGIGLGAMAVCTLVDYRRIERMAVVLPERLFPAFTSLVGCGPAFVFLFMEGLLNAGITMGLKASDSRELIAAMVEGTAKLALESGESFADLRVKVCSPAGTTIRGVNHLERNAVPGHVADAVLEALKRDMEMAGK